MKTMDEIVTMVDGKYNWEVSVVNEIWNVMLRRDFVKSAGQDLVDAEVSYKTSLLHWIRRGEPVNFVLIAFPFKSWRNPLKTDRETPDFGEFAFIAQLVRLARAIKVKYSLGARWTILTEGEAYGEMFGVSGDEIKKYLAGVQSFVKALDGEKIFRFKSFKEVIGVFADFPIRLGECRARISAECNGGVPEKYRDFYRTFMLSQDIREFDKEIMRVVCAARDMADLCSPYHRQIFSRLSTEARKLMVEYCAINEAKHLVGNGGAIPTLFPHHLYISITRKPGRYAIHAINRGTTYLPHHGVPIIRKDGSVSIQWLDGVLLHPEKFEPVFLDGDTEEKPFYYKEISP